MEENLVKKTCKELGVNQKQLAEKMGVHNSTVRHWSANQEIPNMAENFMNILLENKKLKNKFSIVENFLLLINETKGVQNMNNL